MPLSAAEIAEIDRDLRVYNTRGIARDIDHISQDVAMLIEQSDGLPLVPALQALLEPLAIALDAVKIQVEADKT